ncbi:metallophosphoesterase [Parafrankia discariae]|uniref:metallophosphoesterase n=1 Tax=Parafrankia discariae TaxID=365528 RepID=UPI00047549C7|nr:metallophosphoesterase [Parafrankia discariae]
MRVTRLVKVVALAVSGVALSTTAAFASDTPPGQEKSGHFSFAVIGDVPYGSDQVAKFPGWIDQINAAQPEMTFHVGDIKNGSSRCDDDYYNLIKSDFDRFVGPLIYTPGDNEWTDCHRANNGGYNPLERLDFDRSVFFSKPGTTLGQNPITVDSQAAAGFPENVQLRRQGVDFATLHVVGSNNGLQPWTGIGQTAVTPEQTAEENARMTNVIAVVHNAFAGARQRHDRAVALLLQADMFDPTYTPAWTDISAFKPLVQAIVDESSSFQGQVYLFNGDSHIYESDQPLAAGSRWLTTYGVTGSANNLRRVTVDGSSNNVDWLKVTINRPGAAEVLSWERVPYLASGQ